MGGLVIPDIDDDFQELADELLTADDDNFGQSTDAFPIEICVRTKTPGATRFDKPVVTYPGTRVKAAHRGVSRMRDGETLFAMCEYVVTIYAKGVTEPTLDNKISIGGTKYTIVKVEPKRTGPKVAAYLVYVKT